MRPEPGHATLQVPLQACLQRGDGRRLRFVAQRRLGEAELAGPFAERGREHRERFAAGLDRAAPRVDTCCVQGATASREESPAVFKLMTSA